MSQPTGLMAEVTSIPDGTYVTAMGDEDTLFRIQNGRRQAIKLPDVAALGITQTDLPLPFSRIPLKIKRLVHFTCHDVVM
jgi:hypothetical protein